MRKLDLTRAQIIIATPEGKIEQPYDIQDSMIDILMHPELKLNGPELLRNNEVAKKIFDCKEPSILLEETEYNFLKEACNKIRGFQRQDLILVERILNAPQVDVTEKTKGGTE